MPKVSVVMPVYNASKFLKEAIDGILAQTYTDFELILINDGSTDKSEKIINSYNDKRIRYHYQPNAGVAAALNTGVGLAKGTYIWRHDADDISLPTKLEEQINFLKKYPEFDLCAVQVAFMTENGKPAWDYRQPKNQYFGGADFIEVSREHFSPYSPITHGTVLVKTEAMKAMDGYRKEFITGEDVDLWLRLLHKHRLAVLNRCISLHRISSHSATQVHGWKNAFFRNLAFTYYDQREEAGIDDLAKGKEIILPAQSPDYQSESGKPDLSDSIAGRSFRSDLLPFLYALHVNAKDWPVVFTMANKAIKDGWKITNTWKSLLFPLLGNKVIRFGIIAKQIFK